MNVSVSIQSNESIQDLPSIPRTFEFERRKARRKSPETLNDEIGHPTNAITRGSARGRGRGGRGRGDTGKGRRGKKRMLDYIEEED